MPNYQNDMTHNNTRVSRKFKDYVMLIKIPVPVDHSSAMDGKVGTGRLLIHVNYPC